jgi:Glyoxalase/Bleomycin resistance protein/Dioxygenase superfamily
MTMSPKPLSLPGPVRQVGYVVRDLDAAIASWLALGVGPWFVMRDLTQTSTYRGSPCTVPFSLAFSNSGDMQLELIHQEDDTPSIYTEYLDSGQTGAHQLAWWTPDFEATIAEIEAAGYPLVWSGGDADSVRYAYFEPGPGPAAIIEIMELNESTIGMGELVRAAAADWDGSDPIRTLGLG